MTLRSKNIPSFAPRGVIGNPSTNGIVISGALRQWFDMLRFRVERMGPATGTLAQTLSNVEPDGYLFLNGQSVSKKLYPDLYEAILGAYGETSDTFALPDFRNRIPMGAGDIVALGGTAGASEVTLTIETMPLHGHGVIDGGHGHGAVDRGHGHAMMLEEHDHTASGGETHTHDIKDAGTTTHIHTSSLDFTAGNELAAGTDHPRPIFGDTGPSVTGLTETDPPTEAFAIDVEAAQVNGTVTNGRADIKVEASQSNISIEETGGGKPFSIIPPVFGINWMIKT